MTPIELIEDQISNLPVLDAKQKNFYGSYLTLNRSLSSIANKLPHLAAYLNADLQRIENANKLLDSHKRHAKEQLKRYKDNLATPAPGLDPVGSNSPAKAMTFGVTSNAAALDLDPHMKVPGAVLQKHSIPANMQKYFQP